MRKFFNYIFFFLFFVDGSDTKTPKPTSSSEGTYSEVRIELIDDDERFQEDLTLSLTDPKLLEKKGKDTINSLFFIDLANVKKKEELNPELYKNIIKHLVNCKYILFDENYEERRRLKKKTKNELFEENESFKKILENYKTKEQFYGEKNKEGEIILRIEENQFFLEILKEKSDLLNEKKREEKKTAFFQKRLEFILSQVLNWKEKEKYNLIQNKLNLIKRVGGFILFLFSSLFFFTWSKTNEITNERVFIRSELSFLPYILFCLQLFFSNYLFHYKLNLSNGLFFGIDENRAEVNYRTDLDKNTRPRMKKKNLTNDKIWELISSNWNRFFFVFLMDLLPFLLNLILNAFWAASFYNTSCENLPSTEMKDRFYLNLNCESENQRWNTNECLSWTFLSSFVFMCISLVSQLINYIPVISTGISPLSRKTEKIAPPIILSIINDGKLLEKNKRQEEEESSEN